MIEKDKDYSNIKKGKLKEYHYIRFDLNKERDYEEVVFCKNNNVYYEYLDMLNRSHRHNKFFSMYTEEFYGPMQELLIDNFEVASRRGI